MATKTFTVTRDARTVTSPSSMGAGACQHLPVGTYSGYDYHSHLGFTGLSWSGIPNAAAITAAVLEVYTSDANHVGFTSGTVRVRTMGAFNEGTDSHPMGSNGGGITGASRGSYSSTNAVTFAGGTTQNAKKSVSVLNIVKAAFGASAIYLALTADSGVVEFWSRETSYDAKIVITYTAASAPNAPAVSCPAAVNKIVPTSTPTIQIVHSDAQGDAAVRFDCQVMATTGDGVTPAWPVADDATGLASYTYDNTTIATPITWVTGTLTPGQWYAVRARTADAPSGDGAWSAPIWIKNHGTITASFTNPNGNTQIGPMFYDPATNTTPGFLPQWAFSCPEGHGLQSGTFFVKDSTGATVLNGGGSGEAVAAGSTSLKSAYRPANSTSTTYRFDATLTCSGGVSVALTQRTGIRARWGRAAYKVQTTSATAYKSASISQTTSATSALVVEYGASAGGVEPTNWFASPSDVLGGYLHYRVTIVPSGNTNTPTSVTLNSITLNWSNIVAIPFNWTFDTDSVSIDTGKFLYGTQCFKAVAVNGAAKYAHQDVYGLQPNTTYTLSSWVRTDGNARPYLEVQVAGGGSQLAIAGPYSGLFDWTRVSCSFNTGANPGVRVFIGTASDGTSTTQAWFDAIKMEASTVVTPWQPGYVGDAVAIDAGGITIDGSTAAGGIFRVRAADYDPGSGPRYVMAIGAKGLQFADDVELYSDASNSLKTDDALTALGGLFTDGGRLLRYVPLTGEIGAVSLTTSGAVARTRCADFGTIPTDAVAVSVRSYAKASVLDLAARLQVYDYNSSMLRLEAIPGPVANYYFSGGVCPFVLLGGTNNRQFDYAVATSGSTISGGILVTGYWTYH